MIVMINGAFGIGKTTVAQLLVEQLPNAMLFDPEEVGQLLRKVTDGVRSDVEDTENFQDIALWPRLTVVIAESVKREYGRDLIVPMTMANVNYLRQIRSGLRAIDSRLFHFCLIASAQTIHERLIQRGDTLSAWSHQQTERCVSAFQSLSLEFAEHIDAETQDERQIAGLILSRIT